MLATWSSPKRSKVEAASGLKKKKEKKQDGNAFSKRIGKGTILFGGGEGGEKFPTKKKKILICWVSIHGIRQ